MSGSSSGGRRSPTIVAVARAISSHLLRSPLQSARARRRGRGAPRRARRAAGRRGRLARPARRRAAGRRAPSTRIVGEPDEPLGSAVRLGVRPRARRARRVEAGRLISSRSAPAPRPRRGSLATTGARTAAAGHSRQVPARPRAARRRGARRPARLRGRPRRPGSSDRLRPHRSRRARHGPPGRSPAAPPAGRRRRSARPSSPARRRITAGSSSLGRPPLRASSPAGSTPTAPLDDVEVALQVLRDRADVVPVARRSRGHGTARRGRAAPGRRRVRSRRTCSSGK